MAGALIWAGLFMACAAVGAFAARRFAAAVRAAGGSLLTDQERRELVYEQPIRSFARIVADDLAGFDQVIRRQADPTAERWRRVALLAWLAALGVMVLPLLTRGLFRSGAPSDSVPNFVTPAAWLITAFWAAQLGLAIARRRRGVWLLICVAGVAAGVAAILLSNSLLG